MLKNSIILILGTIAFIFSCTDPSFESVQGSIEASYSSSTPVACAGFGYGASIFYKKDQPTDYIESPTGSSLSGTFGATPEGLSINSTNGAINVTQSESGLDYEVYYIPTGSSDTCKVNVIISGIDYASAIKVLSDNDTLSVPFYNGQQSLAPPCSDDDDDDGDDDDDDDGDDDDDDGDDDDDCEFDSGGSARLAGVAIDTLNGTINLKQTVTNGTFGAIPVNGDSVEVSIQYRLNDASNGALNSIDVTFYYFATLGDVPQRLVDQVNEKNRQLNTASTRVESMDRAYLTRLRPPSIIIVDSAF